MTLPAAGADDLLAMAPRLRRYARVLAGDVRDADNLVLATFQRWTDGTRRPRRAASLRARLFAVLHDVYVDRDGPTGRPAIGSVSTSDVPAAAPGTPPAPLQHFARLPPDEREVLLLVAVELMAYDEIALALDVPVATVVARLARARSSMRAARCAQHDEE